ncbi:hypothetical protein Tco_0661013 [Tanacetum coccineum]
MITKVPFKFVELNFSVCHRGLDIKFVMLMGPCIVLVPSVHRIVPIGATRIGAGLLHLKGFKCFDAFLREDKRSFFFKEVGHRPGDFGKILNKSSVESGVTRGGKLANTSTGSWDGMTDWCANHTFGAFFLNGKAKRRRITENEKSSMKLPWFSQSYRERLQQYIFERAVHCITKRHATIAKYRKGRKSLPPKDRVKDGEARIVHKVRRRAAGIDHISENFKRKVLVSPTLKVHRLVIVRKGNLFTPVNNRSRQVHPQKAIPTVLGFGSNDSDSLLAVVLLWEETGDVSLDVFYLAGAGTGECWLVEKYER